MELKAGPDQDEISKIEGEIFALHEKLYTLKRQQPRQEVEDYELQGQNGAVKLSELFGDRQDLLVVHNMGRSCVYCTLWADGLNGLLAQITDRTAFAVVSPDEPEAQQKFATGRGWTFPLYSGKGSTFTKDMGFETGDGVMPGASTFWKEDGKIYRIAYTWFGPSDPFCPPWHLFALLKDGVNDWEPKYKYR